MNFRPIRSKSAKAAMSLGACLVIVISFVGCQKAEEKMKAEEAYVLGMETYVYGFPLVIMDLTKGVLTAAANPGEHSAPMNQFTMAREYVSPDFKNVVRISLNGLWATAFVDLDKEPYVFSAPDTKGRYYVMQALDMWTDDFATIGARNTGTGPGNFLIAGPKWNGTPPPTSREPTSARPATPGSWFKLWRTALRTFPRPSRLRKVTS